MTQPPDKSTAPAGWYPHPSMAGTQRYWDGAKWTDNIAPLAPADPKSGHQSQLPIALVLAGTAIGLVMSLQSASLLTGTGTLWTGVAVACAASITAWVMKRTVPTWVRVVAVLAAVIGIVNVVSVENQLEDKRQEIINLVP